MTQYVTNTNATAGFLGVRAVTYTIKIVSIDISSASREVVWVGFYAYPVSGLSGGTDVSIATLRGGAPPPTATSRRGSISTSAPELELTEILMNARSSGSLGFITSAATWSYQPPLDLTIAPGGVFVVAGLTSTMTASIYFEELRLSQSY